MLKSNYKVEKVVQWICYADDDLLYTLEQLEQIFIAVLDDIPLRKIKYFALPVISAEKMKEFRIAFLHGLTISQAKVMWGESFQVEQMTVIREAFERGLTKKQVKTFADPTKSWEEMKKLSLEIKP